MGPHYKCEPDAKKMNDLVRLMEGLINDYPEQVATYKPVDPDDIQEYEEKLGLVFPKELKALWGFSKGFGIIDYCIIGIKNRFSADILDMNSPLYEFAGNVFLEFMTTSGGESFFVKLDEDSQVLGVFYSDDYFETTRMVSPTLYEFLEDFFIRIRSLLESLDRKDDIEYLEY